MPEEPGALAGAPRSKDEVALELMKFVSITAGYGKGAPTAGFGGKPSRTPEENADALLELFERCRAVVYKVPGEG